MATIGRSLSIRATLVLVACAIAAYIGVIGAYVVLDLNPAAGQMQVRTERLGFEYRQLGDRYEKLRTAVSLTTTLAAKPAFTSADTIRLTALEGELRKIADNSAALQSSLKLTDVSVDMRYRLGDAAAAESQCAATLREAVDYLTHDDRDAARRRLVDVARVREEMETAVTSAQRLALTEMVRREQDFATQSKRVLQSVGAWALAGTVLLTLVTLLLRRRLYVPLAVLDAGLARVAHGDVQTSLPVQREDEFGRVTAQFNQMTEWLRIRQSEDRSRETRLARRFGQIFEHSFNDIYMFEAASLRLVQMNQGALKKLGYEPDQIEGLTVLNVLHGYDEARFRELVQPLVRDEQPGLMLTAFHVRKNGATYPVDITLQLWKADQPAVFVAIAQDVAERRRAEAIRVAAQRIAESALTAPTIERMFFEIHEVIAGLMPASNFYVALYDEEADLISFPYFVDEEDHDDAPAPKKPGRGCTEYVLRTGRPLLLTPEVFTDLADRGEVVLIGPASADWLGVPLTADGKTTGVLVVQSYGSSPRHSEADLGILEFVSTQVSMAVMRRRAEEIVARSRHHLQNVLDAAPFGAMYYVLGPGGRLVFTGANRSADRILGVPCDQFVGKTIEENFPALASTDVPEAYRRAAAEGTPYDNDQVNYDENGINGAFEVHAIQTSPGSMATFFRDITERKRAEVALQRERDLVARIMETSPVGIVLLNRDGKIGFSNNAAARILGLTKSEITSRSFDEPAWKITAHDGGEFPESRLPFARVMATREPVFDVGHAIEWPGGRRVLLAVSGAPIFDAAGEVEAVVTTIEDVTEAIRLQEELRRSEEQYRSLVDGARDLIFSLAPDGRLSTINPAFEDVTGFRREEWLGRPLADLVHPEDAPRIRDLVSLAGEAEGAGMGEMQLRVGTFAGTYRIGELHTTWLLRDDKLAGVLGVVRDITDRVHLEEQVRHAQKMESIGRLAGGVAHDFNNLLTVMLGFTAQAKDSLPVDDPVRADLSEVESAGGKAAALTRQLLAFARRQVTEPRPLDLNAVTLGMDKMLRRLIGEHIDLVTHLASGLWTVSADPGQIEQVIVNLAVNARDAMPNGGTLTIETSNTPVGEGRLPGAGDLEPGDYVTVAVTDTGQGLSADVQEHLFEPFFTTKEKGRGTGLGLATCYGIIAQAGGAIWATGEDGRGTTFTFCLRRVMGSAPRAEVFDGRTPGNGTERILLVEDDESVRRVAYRALTQRGYSVVEAANGQEALDIALRSDQAFDILVTDVVMPLMGGHELAEHLAVSRPAIKVLFTSGYAEDGIVSRGVLKDDLAFLAKPYDLAGLARKVRDVLDGKSR